MNRRRQRPESSHSWEGPCGRLDPEIVAGVAGTSLGRPRVLSRIPTPNAICDSFFLHSYACDAPVRHLHVKDGALSAPTNTVVICPIDSGTESIFIAKDQFVRSAALFRATPRLLRNP